MPALLEKEARFGERGAIMAALRPASRPLPPLLGWLANCLAAAALCLTFSSDSFRWVWYNLHICMQNGSLFDLPNQVKRCESTSKEVWDIGCRMNHDAYGSFGRQK